VGSVTAESVAELRELLLLGADCDDPQVMDLSGVEALDVKGVQLLAAFLKTQNGNRIERPSAAARALLLRLGAFPELLGKGEQP
jgi:ABC-type transporter Mla MlaB component